MQRKIESRKTCQQCGQEIYRTRFKSPPRRTYPTFSGRLEDLDSFTKKRFCSHSCGSKGNRNSFGRKLSKEAKQKIGNATRGKRGWLGKTHTENSRLKMSIAAKNRSPEHIAKFLMGRYSRPNKAESRLAVILHDVFPGAWRYCGDGSVLLGGKSPDFININGEKCLIEMFGDYWHRNDNEEARIKHFAQFGYRTLIIWEHELRNAENVKEKLRSMGWRK